MSAVPARPALHRRDDVKSAVLAIAVLAAFASALRGGFVFDDHLLVEGSALLRGPLHRIWLGADAHDYWPLSYTTFWLEWRLWGDSPLGYHLVNVALHAATAILLWRVLDRLKLPGAWLAALLFAVHPVTVESVAWISERKNVLSGALYAGSILAFLRHRDGVSPRCYAASLLLFLAALLAKTSTVMLPVVLLGIVLFREGKVGRRHLRAVAPFFALSLLLGLVTVWFQWTRAMSATTSGRPLPERLGGAGWALVSYLQTAFLPVNVAVVYPAWPVSPREPLFYLPLAAVLVAFAILWALRRGSARPALVALGYHALLVLPILGIIDLAFLLFSPVGNHLQYLALMGPTALVAAALARAARGRWRALAHATSVAIVLALGAGTAVRAAAYHDDLSLWSRAAREAPQSLVAAWMHAEQLAGVGQPAEALRSLGAAAERIRDPADRGRARALFLLQTRQVDAALREARAARAIRPDPMFDFEIAQMLVQAGRPAEAAEEFAQLVRLEPASPEYRVALGTALAAAGRLDEALEELRGACRRAPRVPGTCATYAQTLGIAGRAPEARAEVAEALGVDVSDPAVDSALANADFPMNQEER